MTRRGKRYGRRFEIATAKVVLGNDVTVRELSEELGIEDSTLRRRAQEYEGAGDDAFPGNGGPKANKDYGIARLRKRIEDLERESELLENFRAFLSQDRA